MYAISVVRDSTEVQVQVTGFSAEVSSKRYVLDVTKLKDSPKALRLTDVVYALEAGMTAYLWWEDKAGGTLILPLEGRGRLDLSPIGGIHNPRNDGWTGHVQITTKNVDPKSLKAFFIGLEFMKLSA